jgi:tRNA threonylcarbamoyladenosine biosynthesis protein TsaB
VHSLFIDSTSGLVIGILGPDYSWVEYMCLDEKKPSEIIHHQIYSLLNKHELNLPKMQCFTSSGPGSYTGMRLGEGIAQVFELSKIPIYSFYHFDVPRMSGVEKGFWITNAFKGQVFLYNWEGENAEKLLINREDFQIEQKKMGYTSETNDPLFAGLALTKNRDEVAKLSIPLGHADVHCQ